MQADAGRETSFPRIFTRPDDETKPWTYVFNCGGETRFGQDPSVYQARSLALSNTLAKECAKRNVPLIDFSDGAIYKAPSGSTISAGGCKEDSALKPWLKISKFKLQAEEGLLELAKFSGLRYVSLRLAHVYGPYDAGFLSRGLCLARVYEAQGRELKWLWGKDLRVNTVHISDVCTAAWLAASWAASHPPKPNTTLADRAFNIADKGDTSQGTLATLFGKIFRIQTGFQGTLVSSFARFNLDSVVDDVNEDILQPWADLLKEKGVKDGGPLSPYMEKELLKDCDLCLNGGKAERELGWRVGRRGLDEEGVREVVESYRMMGWWP